MNDPPETSSQVTDLTPRIRARSRARTAKARPDNRPDLAELLSSWEISLRSEHRKPNTVKTYSKSVRAFLEWCRQTGTDPILDRRTVAAYIAHVIESGAEPATAKVRYSSLRRYSAWLVEEREDDRDDLLGTRPPMVSTKVVEPLTDDELRAMLATCSERSFVDLRDEAILRLAIETGLRAGEALALKVADVDVVNGTAVIRTSKTGTGRVIPFSPTTARSLDRYLRHRRHLTGEQLFLGKNGRSFSYAGLHKTLRERAVRAGVRGFHPHRLRHTAAMRWLGKGGTERGLMAVAGWKDPAMLRRYAAARAEAQAGEEARRLDLGDL